MNARSSATALEDVILVQESVILSVAALAEPVSTTMLGGDRRIYHIGHDTAGRFASAAIDPSGAATLYRGFWHGAAAPSG
jgi:hypothetical protein